MFGNLCRNCSATLAQEPHIGRSVNILTLPLVFGSFIPPPKYSKILYSASVFLKYPLTTDGSKIGSGGELSGGSFVLLDAVVGLRYVDRKVFSGEAEAWAFSAFHKFGGGLGEGRDYHREGDRRVGRDKGRGRAAVKFAENTGMVTAE